MRPEEKECFERWKKETLSEVTAELQAKCGELNSNMREFNAFVSALGRKAIAGFMKAFDFSTKDEFDLMDTELKNAFALNIVSALNAALPVDYPFLVALVFSDPTPELRTCVLDRKSIPGAHDLTSPGVTPIIRIKDMPLGGKVEIRFRPVDVEYSNPGDNLEDLYKLRRR